MNRNTTTIRIVWRLGALGLFSGVCIGAFLLANAGFSILAGWLLGVGGIAMFECLRPPFFTSRGLTELDKTRLEREGGIQVIPPLGADELTVGALRNLFARFPADMNIWIGENSSIWVTNDSGPGEAFSPGPVVGYPRRRR